MFENNIITRLLNGKMFIFDDNNFVVELQGGKATESENKPDD